jgi:peptidyl-prolyl cis-trans isomerase-like protein 2
VTGEKLDADQLIYLHFHKNSQGKYHCPLTFKEFTQNSYIVAIRTSGNVFCYEAIQEFNVKPGIWKDMIDDTKFSKEDIITIQNPAIDQRKWFDPETLKKNTAELDLSKQEVHSTVTKDEPLFTGKRLVKSVRSTSDKKEESVLKKPKVSDEPKKVQNPPTLLTSGACAASFTSTTLAPNTKNPVLAKTDSQMREEIYKKVRKLKSKNKAFVQMETTKGTLVIQLECDKAPRTCHNFVLLCKSGYYNNIKFHRMIPGFMIQGGDPKGNGRGGESAWKDKFADEFTPELRHDRRGILSMANSGPNTNGSQL